MKLPENKTLKVTLNKDTSTCFVCGPNNPEGLRVTFEPEGEKGCRANYRAKEEHCGWPGLLHGGVTSALLDEAVAYALYFHGLFGVTARMETRFREPVAAGTPLVIRAWMVEQRKKLTIVRAEIYVDSPEKKLVAEATATMFLRDAVDVNSPQAN
jgi:uncharacterized protein (TIGR00369 family)